MKLSWLGTNTALIINNTGNIVMIGLLSVCVCIHHTDSDSQQANLYHILDPQYDSVDNKTSMFIHRCTIIGTTIFKYTGYEAQEYVVQSLDRIIRRISCLSCSCVPHLLLIK